MASSTFRPEDASGSWMGPTSLACETLPFRPAVHAFLFGATVRLSSAGRVDRLPLRSAHHNLTSVMLDERDSFSPL